MSWEDILKDNRKYNEGAFEEIKEVFRKLTGEDWEKVFGSGEDKNGAFGKSKISKLLDKYHEEYPMVWEHDLYTPHLLKWLKERLE